MNAKFKIIISMAVFGTIPIFVKNMALPAGEIALYRAIIASVTILIYKIIIDKGISLPKSKKELYILFLSGAAIGFSWILLFQAYNFTTISAATLSYYFVPSIVLIASTILFREKLTAIQIIYFIMATIGLIFIIGGDSFGLYNVDIKGIIFGLGAAALYATVVVLNKFIKTVTGIDKTFIQLVAASFVLIPYVSFTTGIHINSLNSVGIINLLILGVFHTGITYCLFFSSLRDLSGQEASILSYVDPLVAILVSVSFFGETISFIQIIGGIMILGFSSMNELNISPAKLYKKLRIRI